jgi:hypothetical protein
VDGILGLVDRDAEPGRRLAREMTCVGELAVDVELELLGRPVADADGGRPLVSGQPVELFLGEAALARDSVHDPQVTRTAGSRTQQPVPEGQRLLGIAALHERAEGQHGVADPAEAVVPVLRTPPIASGSDAVGAATIPPVGA